MGMLEVHDGRGRVNFVPITPDRPLVFGTDASCDIVLHGEGVFPVHGRLRWKETRYKVDAAPEAKYVEVNGRKAASASVRQGDEVRVGPCIIYLTQADEPPAAPDRGARHAEPTAVAAIPSEVSAAADLSSGPATAAPAPQKRGINARVQAFFKELLTGDQRPGQERIASPLVVLLAGAVVVMLSLSFVLYRVIHRAQVEAQYASGMESFENADYRNAVADFDAFMKGNPDDPRVNKVKVFQAAAKVRQFATGASPNWSNAVTEAETMVNTVGKYPEYRDESAYLAELVLKAAEGLADRARTSTDPKILAEAEAAGKLHSRIAGKPAKDLQGRSRYPEKLSVARAAVEKAQTRTAELAAMEKAQAARDPAGIYAARDKLILKYPDLSRDKLVVKQLTAANDLLRVLAKFDGQGRPAATGVRPEPLGPPTSLALRLNPAAAAATGKGAAVVYALAQGMAVGLDGASGKPLWQSPVGLSSPFPPLAVRGDEPSAIAFDARHQELVRLDGRTGKPLWRLPLGERVSAPPLVAGNQLAQPTPSGRLLLINLPDGALQGSIALGRPLGVTPATDENGLYFYVVGDSAVLYVVSRETHECVDVTYLGHASGSIPCPPARVGRYLIIPENYAKDECRWNVLVLEDSGKKPRPAQQIKLPGWIWDTPAASQAVIWATGDRAGVAAYALGPYDQPEPIKLIARLASEAASTGPAFGHVKSDRELWLSSGLSARYDLDIERGALRTAWTLREAGPALAPIQAADKLAVLTHQYSDGPGVALWGVDPAANGKVAWRTVLGVPWPAEPSPAADGQSLTALAGTGVAIPLARDRLARGGFVEEPLPKPGTFALPAGALHLLDVGGLTVLVPAADAAYLLVREGSGGEFRRVDLPAPLAALPLALGTDLLLPASGGRAFLIDPRTGAPKAEPYLAVFDQAHPTRWKAPVTLTEGVALLADDAGKLRRLSRQESGAEGTGPRLVAADEVALGVPLAADPAVAGETVLLAGGDGKLYLRSARDLAPIGQAPLAAPLALGPLVAGGNLYVADASGNVLAFAPDGHKLWEADLGEVPPVGPPILRGDAALFLDRNGVLHRLALADGKPLAPPQDLDVLPSGPPQVVGDDVSIPVGPGSLRRLDLAAPAPAAAAANP